MKIIYIDGKIPDNPSCAWCFKKRPDKMVHMNTFDNKTFFMHYECHKEFLKFDFEGRPELIEIMDKEYAHVGKRDPYDALMVGDVKCDSPLFGCQLLRAQYERKKASIQIGRYDEGLELAKRLESKEVTIEQQVEMAHALGDKLTRTRNGNLDIELLRYRFEEVYAMKISVRRANSIRKRHDLKYPQEIE